ncbi:MAG: helix-turn-helix transcriptional regulator [Pirellulales bacterium]
MDSRLLWGIVEMLVLDVVSRGQSYGYEISQQVTAQSAGYFDLKEGSLYPALHRLERHGLLAATWAEADGRRRKYYKLTTAGKKAHAAKTAEWARFVAGVSGVLGGASGVA